jgi:pimeloyl-ACP methyl ester carboxylesterase
VETLAPIRYAHNGKVSIAYTVFGEASVDLLFIGGFVSHLEIGFEAPAQRFWERMASFARVIVFDKRGMGLSDRDSGAYTLENVVDDALAVLDACAVERAAVVGVSEGGSAATMMAATHPERVSALIQYGMLADFDGPARAVRCALAIRTGAHVLGLEVRSGVHTGECEAIGDDLTGIAVHLTARLMAAARPAEVIASGTVRDLVVGSGLQFEERGTRSLPGVPGEWALFAVAGDEERTPPAAPAEKPAPAEMTELSRRELDVLALVAEGLTNETIAARLYISVRTVERHLSNVYAKLRLSGKSALAAAAARFSSSR